MYTFVANFTRWLTRQGMAFTDRVEDEYDVLLANSWAVPYALVRQAKRTHPQARVLHRVDGSAADYGGNPVSDRLQARVNLLADVTVFQSDYSRYSTREKFKVLSQDGPVIYNPVDLDAFRPDGPSRTLPPAHGPRIACASWSVNRMKGTWQIDELAAAHPDWQFVLCGRFDAISARPNIVVLGRLSHQDLAGAFRACDLFLNLSENDPCPNVVIEALASGLPVVYRHSGGVPELVGDAGVPFTTATVDDAVSDVMAARDDLASRARRRAEERFAPDVVFPQYLETAARARRQPRPSAVTVLKLARAGYPLLTPTRSPQDLVAGVQRRGRTLVRRLLGRTDSASFRVGWVTYDAFPRRKRRWAQLDSFTGMRVGNVARWLNAHASHSFSELYDPDQRYDVVVFQKTMHAACQAEAEKIRAYGGKVIFDANVNYYETWGDYFVPGTEPTRQQQHDAVWMTTFADHVVADSSYLADVIRPHNARVTWIPDNVDLEVYRGQRTHGTQSPVRLVWSGVAKKAAHLLLIVDALASLQAVELTLVVDERPECLAELQRALPCRTVRFSNAAYARTLLESDIIVSPKRLVNAYELAHTEYKITLGMAVGLPVVASPQRSYIEALADGGGILASTDQAWRDALQTLASDAALRADHGERGRQTVIARYSTPVVAAAYGRLIEQVAGAGTRAAERSESAG